jgi:hypothetical protein
MSYAAAPSPWFASGLRLVATLFNVAAARLEHTFANPDPRTQDLYFDSDVYLAQVKDRAQRQYY